MMGEEKVLGGLTAPDGKRRRRKRLVLSCWISRPSYLLLGIVSTSLVGVFPMGWACPSSVALTAALKTKANTVAAAAASSRKQSKLIDTSVIRKVHGMDSSVLFLRGGAKSVVDDFGNCGRPSNDITFKSHGDRRSTSRSGDVSSITNLSGGAEEGTKSKSSSSSSSTTTTTTNQLFKFPIKKSEMKQFLSMSTMMFLFIYVFTTVRDTKDTLVVSNCGAESIPFVKLYGVMPCAALFIVMYSKCSNWLSRKALFYCTLLPFFVFYTVFAFVLYPFRDAIHFLPEDVVSGAAAGGADAVVESAKNLLRHWSFSLYFIVSELWASAGVPLLFWQCANDVTSLGQAKRFYPLFAVIGNLAPIISGKVMSFVVSLQNASDDVSFGQTLKVLASIKVAICLGIIALYNYVYDMADRRAKREKFERTVRTLHRLQHDKEIEFEVKFSTKKKKKPTLSESIKELSKSRELKSMATMVICYNMCIELTEVLWKGILRKTFNTQSDYMDFMANFSQTVGYVAFLLQLCAGSIIRILGWQIAALLTPLSMVLLAVPFFAAVLLGEEEVPLATALLIGTAQNVVSKVTKYSLFDPCKEMAYIPLGPEAKVKGKAAVDVLGARLGRSLGSASQQLLVATVGSGSIIPCAPYLGVLYVAVVTKWSQAVLVLGKLFAKQDAMFREGDAAVQKVKDYATKTKTEARAVLENEARDFAEKGKTTARDVLGKARAAARDVLEGKADSKEEMEKTKVYARDAVEKSKAEAKESIHRAKSGAEAVAASARTGFFGLFKTEEKTDEEKKDEEKKDEEKKDEEKKD